MSGMPGTRQVGMFSMLNRISDAHGLDYPTSGWYPPGLREKLEKEKTPGNSEQSKVP